eukprot:CAMPEP_0181471150 /NCGR_PEP_ID=MMETSP1110-20121109/38924_1 /TAXON_ID=174948 /ORGANISM="Symbiodinium sp., Strain CCMP421" /LENGTH=158 /DNA_ID=CAMNT_0023596155 /DNA_START=129 /DNA_END=603 /DNA_ORIENTATION=+
MLCRAWHEPGLRIWQARNQFPGLVKELMHSALLAVCKGQWRAVMGQAACPYIIPVIPALWLLAVAFRQWRHDFLLVTGEALHSVARLTRLALAAPSSQWALDIGDKVHLPDSSLLLTVGGASGCRLCARDSGETADSRQGVAGIRILAESRRACAAAK